MSMVAEVAQLLGSIAAVVAAISSTINGRKAKKRAEKIEGKVEEVHKTLVSVAPPPPDCSGE